MNRDPWQCPDCKKWMAWWVPTHECSDIKAKKKGTLKKGMATGNGPAPTVPPTVVCYREDVGMEQG